MVTLLHYSAKKLVKGEPNVSYICSRYYRAPELIFGATDYTVDIGMWNVEWSSGMELCVIVCISLFSLYQKLILTQMLLFYDVIYHIST